jgi:transposase
MEGSRNDLRKQLTERESEVRDLRDRLNQAQADNDRLRQDHDQVRQDNDRLRRENEQLRKELKAAGRGKSQGQSKRKKKRKRSGRKAGKGPFTFRGAPSAAAANGPPQAVPVTITQCPCCGGELHWERTDDVSVTDMPERPQPEVKCYAVEVLRCEACGQHVRGQHPDVAPDQYGATAHRVGPRVKAAAHAVHYGMGVPVRKVPAILREFTGVEVTQSALTQDALKKSTGSIGNAYQELRAGVAQAPVTYTDDTGWSIHGQSAHLMAFDTDQATVFQIRNQHRNEEVRELIPSDYGGVMVTDRGKSYDAEELSNVDQQKCLDHLKRNIDEVLETKKGPARRFGLNLKKTLKDSRKLWRNQRAGKAKNFPARAKKLDEELTYHLRPRFLKDEDNQRLLDGIGEQHDRGSILRFLSNPAVEPTNNRSERAVRPAVIARKLSHGSKSIGGAEAYAAFTSVIQTAVKRGASSIFSALNDLIGSKAPEPSATKAHDPPS